MPAGQVCDGGHSGSGLCRKGSDFIHSFLSLPGPVWPHPVVRCLPRTRCSAATNAPRVVEPLERTARIANHHEKMEARSAIDSELRELCFGCRNSPCQPALVWGS